MALLEIEMAKLEEIFPLYLVTKAARHVLKPPNETTFTNLQVVNPRKTRLWSRNPLRGMARLLLLPQTGITSIAVEIKQSCLVMCDDPSLHCVVFYSWTLFLS